MAEPDAGEPVVESAVAESGLAGMAEHPVRGGVVAMVMTNRLPVVCAGRVVPRRQRMGLPVVPSRALLAYAEPAMLRVVAIAATE